MQERTVRDEKVGDLAMTPGQEAMIAPFEIVDLPGADAIAIKVEDRVYMLDVNQVEVLEAHPALVRVLRMWESSSEDQIIDSLVRDYDEELANMVLDDFKELTQAGYFSPSAPASRIYDPPVYTIMISTVHACNLRCSYCFSDAARKYKGKQRSIEFTTAKQSIDYLIGRYKDKGKPFYINFTGDGETMLNFEIIRQVVDYCEQIAAGPEGIKFRFGFVTNGTILPEDKMQYLIDHDVALTFSVDGPKEVHDSYRVLPNGRGSYDTLIANMQRYHERANTPKKATAVLTADHTNFVEIIKHYADLGLDRMSAKPPRTDGKNTWGLNQDSLERYKKGYSDLAVFLLQSVLKGDYRYIDLIANVNDYLGRFLGKLLNRSKNTYRCDAGKSRFVLSADGSIYPCQDLIGEKDMRIGSVEDGIYEERQQRYYEMGVDDREPCRSCFARYQCGGGCYANAHKVNGALDKPDEVKCDLVRHLVRLAVYMLCEIQRENPRAIKHIHRKFAGVQLENWGKSDSLESLQETAL